jgi:hypothetical protein
MNHTTSKSQIVNEIDDFKLIDSSCYASPSSNEQRKNSVQKNKQASSSKKVQGFAAREGLQTQTSTDLHIGSIKKQKTSVDSFTSYTNEFNYITSNDRLNQLPSEQFGVEEKKQFDFISLKNQKKIFKIDLIPTASPVHDLDSECDSLNIDILTSPKNNIKLNNQNLDTIVDDDLAILYNETSDQLRESKKSKKKDETCANIIYGKAEFEVATYPPIKVTIEKSSSITSLCQDALFDPTDCKLCEDGKSSILTDCLF